MISHALFATPKFAVSFMDFFKFRPRRQKKTLWNNIYKKNNITVHGHTKHRKTIGICNQVVKFDVLDSGWYSFGVSGKQAIKSVVTTVADVQTLKGKNVEKIRKMEQFKNDWNGNGGVPFSQRAIEIFYRIINELDIQPQIAPTGRNSLLLQYEKGDNSMLAFEVKEESAEMVYIPQGDYSKAVTKVIEKNVINTIALQVGSFYGSGSY